MSGSPGFSDHFSAVAGDYAASRPTYPRELFDWLRDLCSSHELALDVGTGNGQAAVALAEPFTRVVATDPSREQLARAVPHARVEYRCALAHERVLEPVSADLITAATAAHWFESSSFHAEVERVLKPGGVLAVWNYAPASVSDAVDAVLATLNQRVAPFWPPERRFVDTGYRTLPFPYADLATPRFQCRMSWTARQFLDYAATWTAVQRARRELPTDVLADLAPQLERTWGREAREVVWPIALRAGRKPR
jgi:ubiquinone/menaquinone biosynthesis C-methylase UbiE